MIPSGEREATLQTRGRGGWPAAAPGRKKGGARPMFRIWRWLESVRRAIRQGESRALCAGGSLLQDETGLEGSVARRP